MRLSQSASLQTQLLKYCSQRPLRRVLPLETALSTLPDDVYNLLGDGTIRLQTASAQTGLFASESPLATPDQSAGINKSIARAKSSEYKYLHLLQHRSPLFLPSPSHFSTSLIFDLYIASYNAISCAYFVTSSETDKPYKLEQTAASRNMANPSTSHPREWKTQSDTRGLEGQTQRLRGPCIPPDPNGANLSRWPGSRRGTPRLVARLLRSLRLCPGKERFSI